MVEEGRGMEETENIYIYIGEEKRVEMNARSEETPRNDAWNVPAWGRESNWTVAGDNSVPPPSLMNGERSSSGSLAKLCFLKSFTSRFLQDCVSKCVSKRDDFRGS